MLPFHGTRVDASSQRMTFKPPNTGCLAKAFDENVAADMLLPASETKEE
jgi:hypothetical protein